MTESVISLGSKLSDLIYPHEYEERRNWLL